jgi:hypothetical protein
MLKPTLITWFLIIFGLITCGPLLYAQLIMLSKPQSDKAKILMIGKGEEWRDKSHFRSQVALAHADWLIFAPVFVGSIIGMILAKGWGYILFAIAGAIQLYINVFLGFFEREYVYPAQGFWAYYTYYWGNFIYWGLAALIYSVLRLNDIII